MKKTMRGVVHCAILLAMATAGSQSAGEDLKPGQWRIDAQQTRFSNLLDGHLLDDEKSPVQNVTDRIDSWARSEWRATWKPQAAPWDLQWAAFVDAQVHMEGSGGRAAARINNQVMGASGARYPFKLEGVKYRRLGMFASRAFDGAGVGLKPNRWTVGASVFAVDQFKSFDVRGVLEDRPAGGLTLETNVIENELGKRSAFIRPEKILGWGLAVDVSAVWGRLEADFLRLSVEDMGAPVRLSQLLGTDRTINTDTISFDPDGYIQFAPIINGVNTNRKATVRIKPELRVEAGWQPRTGQRWLGRLVKHGARQEVALVYQRALAGYRLSVGAHALSNMPGSVSVGLGGSDWGVSWRGDHIHPGQARVWSLSGQFAY